MNTIALIMAVAIERPRVIVGGVIMVMGGLLLLATGGYVALGIYDRSQFDKLIVTATETGFSLENLTRDIGSGFSEEEIDTLGFGVRTATEGLPTNDDAYSEDDFQPAEGALAAERPGEGYDFRQLRSEASIVTSGSAIGAQFTPVDFDALPYTLGTQPRPGRIQIPAIGLDSKITDLRVVWDGPDLQWQTADSAVGYHVGSPTPGERGNTVFSGHINSPFRGEGSIFSRLPEVAALLREGQTVDIIIETGEMRYLYRATATDVTLPEDANVFRSVDTPSLSLVTCVPARSYTHRFIVNALLVGEAPLA